MEFLLLANVMSSKEIQSIKVVIMESVSVHLVDQTMKVSLSKTTASQTVMLLALQSMLGPRIQL